ncbi:hypothetical protein GCM10010250_51300 [Streptomyces althioticus]|nr:hypothetical protein GCM10010250_51300 [Streptomyces althioticus]
MREPRWTGTSPGLPYARIGAEVACLPCGMRYKTRDPFEDCEMSRLVSSGLFVGQCAASAAPDSHRRVPVRRELGEPGTHTKSLG